MFTNALRSSSVSFCTATVSFEREPPSRPRRSPFQLVQKFGRQNWRYFYLARAPTPDRFRSHGVVDGPRICDSTNGSLASAATVLAERTHGGNSSARSNSGRGGSSAEALFFILSAPLRSLEFSLRTKRLLKRKSGIKQSELRVCAMTRTARCGLGIGTRTTNRTASHFRPLNMDTTVQSAGPLHGVKNASGASRTSSPIVRQSTAPRAFASTKPKEVGGRVGAKTAKSTAKYFSVAKHGYEGAKRKAIAWRRDRECGIPIEKPARRTCDEVKGVCYDTLGKRWQASWSQQGRRISKRFPIAEHGAERAKELAIQWRREREAEARLISGCRLRVWWSAEAHSEAGYSDRGIDGAWYDATVTSAGTDTISVRYDVGENKHFVKLAKSLLTASPGIQGIALRVAQSELDAAKRPKQRKQGVKRARAKRDEKRASISDPQIMVRAHASVACAREHGSNDSIDGMFVASCVLHPVCCILRTENDISRSMCMPVPETHRHGRPSLIFFHMMILRLTSK